MELPLANPHLKAWRRARAHRRAESGFSLGWLFPLAAVAAAGWMARTVLLGFLAVDDALAAGVTGLAMRLGLVCCGAMAIFSYGALVRGEDRPVLDPHPVDPGKLLPYLLLRAGAERWAWPLGVSALAWPLVFYGQPVAFALIVAVCFGGWLVGLTLGFPTYLAAIWAAESPSLALVFELIRGTNPRLQAALIYAPGAVLALGGVAVYAAASGAGLVMVGQPLGVVLLVAPLILSALAWLPTPALARAYYFRTTTLLAEVDGMYAGMEDPEEARRVYLDWAVKFTPASVRSETLKELRHGWRGLRSWVTGAWGAGLVGAVAGWSADPVAPARAALVAGAGMVLVGAVAVRLSSTDPMWLDRSLPVPSNRRLMARGFAVFGWLQGAIVPVAAVVGVRQGGAVLGVIVMLEGMALLIAIVGAASSRMRAKGMLPYVALGALAWAGLAGVTGISGGLLS